MLKNYGLFTIYRPTPKQLPMDHPWRAIGALFLKNENNEDWYNICHNLPKNTPGVKFVCVKGDDVISIDTDAEKMWPVDCFFIETDEPVEMHYQWDGFKFNKRNLKKVDTLDPPKVVGGPTRVA